MRIREWASATDSLTRRVRIGRALYLRSVALRWKCVVPYQKVSPALTGMWRFSPLLKEDCRGRTRLKMEMSPTRAMANLRCDGKGCRRATNVPSEYPPSPDAARLTAIFLSRCDLILSNSFMSSLRSCTIYYRQRMSNNHLQWQGLGTALWSMRPRKKSFVASMP